MQQHKTDTITPEWHGFLHNREIVGSVRRKRKKQLLLGILGCYTVFVGVFSFFYMAEKSEVVLAAEPADVIGGVRLVDPKSSYRSNDNLNFHLTVQNSSDLSSAKNIKIGLYTVDQSVEIKESKVFGLDNSLINPAVDSKVVLNSLGTLQRGEYLVSSKIGNNFTGDVEIVPILSYYSKEVYFEERLNSIYID